MEKRMTNRQIAALETKRKLIEAAKAVIEEKGFENATTREIVDRAGVAYGSFYTYFPKKEDLITELNKTDFFRLAETVNAMTDAELMEKLTYYCREFLRGIERSGMEICRQWIRNNLSPQPIKPSEDDGCNMTKYEFDHQAVLSILTEAIKCGQLKPDAPVEQLTLFINSQLYGLMVAWCMSDGKVDGAKEAVAYCETALKQILAPYMQS